MERPPTTVLSRSVSQVIYQYIFQIDTSVPTGELSEGAQLSLVCGWDRHLPHLGNVRLSRLEHDILLHRSFKYCAVWLLPLIPELFLHDMLYFSSPNRSATLPHTQTPHYTPLLHCSLLAFTAAFSDNPEISSWDTRNKFAARAKQLLDNEFAHPTPSLVQSLALLAEYHCGIAERDAGYMYLGKYLDQFKCDLADKYHFRDEHEGSSSS
jgi:hypothetical protein